MITNFCFCFNLRTSTIVFAWLQLITFTITIAGCATALEITEKFIQTSRDRADYSYTQAAAAPIITWSSIKIAACLALIWGAARRKHLFFQPWLFVFCVENIIFVLFFIALFVTGCFIPIFFAFAFPCLICAAFGWYFWFCVYSVYKEDCVPSLTYWGIENTEASNSNIYDYNNSTYDNNSRRGELIPKVGNRFFRN